MSCGAGWTCIAVCMDNQLGVCIVEVVRGNWAFSAAIFAGFGG